MANEGACSCLANEKRAIPAWIELSVGIKQSYHPIRRTRRAEPQSDQKDVADKWMDGVCRRVSVVRVA